MTFRKFFSDSFAALTTAAALIDAGGEIVIANQAFLEVLKDGTEQIIGKKLSAFCLPGSALEREMPFTRNWQGSVHWTNSKGLGILIQLNAIVLLEDGVCHGTLIFIQPALLENVAESELSHRAKQLESLGLLSASIAHDLNNILTGVLGHVSFLRLSLEGGDSNSESLLAIEDSARKAASMTQQIVEFAKGGSIEKGPVDFAGVIGAGARLLSSSFPKEISFSHSVPKEKIYIHGDEGELTQLVMNLAINARDAISGAGKIHLVLRRLVVESTSDEEDSNLPPGVYAHLRISDDGDGIPLEIQDKIFEPFFTTKDSKGTGVGLATVASIVNAHAGEIFVDSESGRGTTFDIYLPMTEERLSEEAQSQTETGLPKSERSERILVIDDEESIRLVVQKSLEHLGYQVEVVASGAEALEKFSDQLDSFSLVILDMIMPKMSGDQVFLKLKELHEQVPVLLASGYSNDRRARVVLDGGGLGYIQKPFAVEDLAIEVRRCIDESQSK
ncbi:hypothetical protein BVY02_00185 [bacterium J17]|nr:hypothetical protein BVY02_00185 [bacterium J17]